MRILTIFGTRPEAIKMAPVVRALKNEPFFDTRVIVTAQHRQMLDQVLNFFEIFPDQDLDLMEPKQSLSRLSANILLQLEDAFETFDPNLVMVHGDTTTTFSTSFAAFLNKIPVAHVEAGLRTYDLTSPWPEEANRQLTSRITSIHFAPTRRNRDALLKEGVLPEQIYVTGNTVVDALLFAREKIFNDPTAIKEIETYLFERGLHSSILNKCFILVTGHRRENFGDGFENICTAIKTIAKSNSNIQIIYPVHLNPMVWEPVYSHLAQLDNVHLVEPLDYKSFVYLMNKCYFILTDSGGVQEEAPSLGKPVLVMRDKTERQEAIDSGTVRLVGTDFGKIVAEVQLLLDQKAQYRAMSQADNPYGDGAAAKKIIENLKIYAKNSPVL